jgi:hypothetical protein
MSGYKFNLPVKSDQLEAIGMVATEWAYLESIIEAAIWSLAWLDEDRGEAITTHFRNAAAPRHAHDPVPRPAWRRRGLKNA